jgi:hypothetical protein
MVDTEFRFPNNSKISKDIDYLWLKWSKQNNRKGAQNHLVKNQVK